MCKPFRDRLVLLQRKVIGLAFRQNRQRLFFRERRRDFGPSWWRGRRRSWSGALAFHGGVRTSVGGRGPLPLFADHVGRTSEPQLRCLRDGGRERRL